MRNIHGLCVPEMMEDDEKALEEWEPVGRGERNRSGNRKLKIQSIKTSS